RAIPVWSEVELGYRLLGGPAMVGVTGTNGKTTTSGLLGEIFRAAGRDVVVAGNVGSPLTAARAADWIVCELSSFQLEDPHAPRRPLGQRLDGHEHRRRPPRRRRLRRPAPARPGRLPEG